MIISGIRMLKGSPVFVFIVIFVCYFLYFFMIGIMSFDIIFMVAVIAVVIQ